MKKKYILLCLFTLLCIKFSNAQVSYSGNGNSGFGGPIGNASMTINDNGTTITFTFTKGGGDFNDAMVMYISTGATGRTLINGDVNDTADGLRRAISNAGSSDISFPTGFQATHGIAIDTGFGGLWSIPATGSIAANDLVFTKTVGNPVAATTASFTFSFDWSDIGLTTTDKFDFVITYGNPNDSGNTTMFSSDEAFGNGISSSNPGTAAMAFTGDKSYPNTWTGTTDNVWATGTNWTEGTPTATHNVYIPMVTNQPTTAAAVTINRAVINSGASLVTTSTFSGDITYKRTLTKDADLTKAWYLVASPVAGETIGNLISNHNFASGTGTNIGLAPYDNTQVDVNNRWNYQSTGSTGTVNSGQGYSVKLDNGSVGSTISFTGTINTANITPSIVDGNTVNTGGSPYNLIGNPYTAFINSGLFLTANTTILESETIWLWNQANDSYDTKVTADAFKVAPTQSFFVERKASGVATNFTFDVTNQNHETTDTFQRASRSEIQLFISNNTDSRYAKIYYVNGTTTGFDNGYDGELFSGLPTNFSLYTQLISGNVGKNYQIQSLPYTNFETMVLPIGLKAAAGDVTFTADAMNLPANYKVFLEDRIADTFTRLDEVGQKYQVTLATASEGIGRFYLHTAESVLTVNNEALESVSIYKYDKTTIRITGLQQGKTTISLFNILGKQVVNTSFEANGVQDISLPKLASGIYVLQLKTTTGKLNKRIILE